MAAFWIIVVTGLFCLAVELLVNWSLGLTKKEESEDRVISKTKSPRRTVYFSIVMLVAFTAFFAAGAVLLAVYEKDFPITGWIAFTVGAMLLIPIPLLLTLLVTHTYEVIQKDGILVKRLTKTKFIAWSEMGSYSYSFDQIVVYDHSQKIIFTIDNRVGKQAVLEQLREHNISIKKAG